MSNAALHQLGFVLLVLALVDCAGSRYSGDGTIDSLPLVFEINHGRNDGAFDFVSRGRGHTLFIAATSVVFANAGTSSRVTMTLVGANAQAHKNALCPLAGKLNYIVGNDPSQWRTNLPTFAKVEYKNVYRGIDVVYRSAGPRLEYDFIVAPGADSKAITLQFERADEASIDRAGDLVVADLRLRRPSMYQEVRGRRRAVDGGFTLRGRHRIGFEIGAYDVTRPLVIDPVVVFSTRLGGADGDAGWAVATDAAGDVYVTGDAASANFPLANAVQRKSVGATDAFVTKLSPDGSRILYSTYLGGSDADVGQGIAVDPLGNVYITGDTRSRDFPLVKALQGSYGGTSDVFVAKLSPDGSQLLYSTYVGGRGGERGLGIAVDAAGNAFVAGYTNSPDFPTVNAVQSAFGGGDADGFVFKLNPTSSAFIYSTYLGGRAVRPELATSIAVDVRGNAYVAGFTNSTDFPTLKPIQPFRGPTDAFIAKLNPVGMLVYSTYIGGKADDEAMAIAVDTLGSAYITGHTESVDFPTTKGAYRTTCVPVAVRIAIGNICTGGDAFVVKMMPDGSALAYGTYIEGTRFEVGRAIAVDAPGNAYVAGLTNSLDFPIVRAVQSTNGGGDFDAFSLKLNTAGTALLFSTFLGGNKNDGGYGIAADPAGNAIVTGYTASADFPLSHHLRRTIGNTRDVFVTKIRDSR
jgi:hypothetical protein